MFTVQNFDLTFPLQIDLVRTIQPRPDSLELFYNQLYKQPLRGRVLNQLLDELRTSIDKLGFAETCYPRLEGQAEDLNRRFDVYEVLSQSAKKKVTYPALQKSLIIGAIEQLCGVDEERIRLAKDKIDQSPFMLNARPYFMKSPNVKSLLRNVWISRNLLGEDPTVLATHGRTKDHLFSLLKVSPLESLITLNSLYECLSALEESVSVEDFLADFGQNNMRLIMFPSANFPATLRERILRQIGFSDQQVAHLLRDQSVDW